VPTLNPSVHAVPDSEKVHFDWGEPKKPDSPELNRPVSAASSTTEYKAMNLPSNLKQEGWVVDEEPEAWLSQPKARNSGKPARQGSPPRVLGYAGPKERFKATALNESSRSVWGVQSKPQHVPDVNSANNSVLWGTSTVQEVTTVRSQETTDVVAWGEPAMRQRSNSLPTAPSAEIEWGTTHVEAVALHEGWGISPEPALAVQIKDSVKLPTETQAAVEAEATKVEEEAMWGSEDVTTCGQPQPPTTNALPEDEAETWGEPTPVIETQATPAAVGPPPGLTKMSARKSSTISIESLKTTNDQVVAEASVDSTMQEFLRRARDFQPQTESKAPTSKRAKYEQEIRTHIII
jgi:hypothetical protein